MKILIVTESWHPQVNGVVRTLTTLRELLEAAGHEVLFITPDMFPTFPCPTYPEIRLPYWTGRKLVSLIEEFQPDAIHLQTEGPLGWSARHYCRKHGLPFTTAYHTRFPEYVHARCRFPLSLGYKVMNWFHSASSAIMVATESISRDIEARGFTNIRKWSRGVDTELFRPRDKGFLTDARPIHMYVGRVAVEKNIEAFLDLDLEGTKYVVGTGPQLEELQKRYPDVIFTGRKYGEELAQYYAAADVFVFPSLTDTFGIVMLEALASGVPVAAYPVPGPIDVVGPLQVGETDRPVGALDDDLKTAITRALACRPQDCRDFALTQSWDNCARLFLENLAPLPAGAWDRLKAGKTETVA